MLLLIYFELILLPLNREMLQSNSKTWNGAGPRKKKLNTVTNSFKMIQFADFTGSGNSVVMHNITE